LFVIIYASDFYSLPPLQYNVPRYSTIERGPVYLWE
jgi:hypothetical protein